MNFDTSLLLAKLYCMRNIYNGTASRTFAGKTKVKQEIDIGYATVFFALVPCSVGGVPLRSCICSRCYSTPILITALADLTAPSKIYRFAGKLRAKIEYIGLSSYGELFLIPNYFYRYVNAIAVILNFFSLKLYVIP